MHSVVRNKVKKLVIDTRQSDQEDSDYESGNTNGNHSKAQKPMQDDDICELEYLRKLFIGGLSPNTTEENLKAYYEQWGKVVDVIVMRDPTTKRSRGFGFITYTKSSMVDKAQDNRPHVIDGKSVEAKRARPRPERDLHETTASVKKLFVGGLKDNHDENCLQEYFSQFGKVLSVNILTDKTTGKRRGFAYIAFDDYDAVDQAILQRVHSIKYVEVDVKKSVYKQDPQFKEKQRAQPPPQNLPPMNGGQPPGPPPNYNYWGQQPPPMPYGYQQPQPPMNNWGYPPTPNAWYGGPPQPAPNAPMPNNWYPQQQPWSGPPQPHPSMAGPPGAPPDWNAPLGPPVVPPPQQQQQMTPNFGTGYQQSYNGGPTKHNANTNRMNPYGGPPSNAYDNQPRPVPPVGTSTYQR